MKNRFTALAFGLVLLTAQASPEPLSSIAEAKRLSDDGCRTPQPFVFTGTVLSEGKHVWFFRDATGGAEILNRQKKGFLPPCGSTVRIHGEMMVEKNGARKFLATTVDLLRTNAPEEPVDATVADVLNGQMDFRRVRIKGVISAFIPDEVDNSVCWASLRAPSGTLFLTLYGKWNDPALREKLIDAEVILTGLATAIVGLRRNLGRCILISSNDSISTLVPPLPDPFSAPDLSDSTLPHRQKVHGTVLATEPRRFFLKTLAGRILPVVPIISAHVRPPVAGDLVTVVGFAVDDPYRIQFSDAIVRIDGQNAKKKSQVTPRTLKSLFFDDKGGARIDSRSDGTFISVQGTVSPISRSELSVSDGEHALSIDIATLQMLGIPVPADGSRVSACGLCLAEFEHPQTPSIYPTFKRFVLIPQDHSDIVVLAHPSWWTPFRLTMLVIVLVAILLGSTHWNIALKRKSEKRGRELYAERIDHALAEQKVEERTRLAVELHDSVSQTLTGVALQLDGGEVETAKTMLASCRGELRRCLWDLRSRTFEEKDMTEAVTRTITPHLNGAEATVRFNVPRERLSESLTHAILRIVRELVVNAIRHGQAKHIRIAGEMHANTVSFSATDDGCGFEPETAPGPKQGHFGLLGIRERIEDFDGSLRIASSPGHGAKFTVTLIATDETNEQ